MAATSFFSVSDEERLLSGIFAAEAFSSLLSGIFVAETSSVLSVSFKDADNAPMSFFVSAICSLSDSKATCPLSPLFLSTDAPTASACTESSFLFIPLEKRTPPPTKIIKRIAAPAFIHMPFSAVSLGV